MYDKNGLTADMRQYIENTGTELEDLIEALCAIPAPSHHEEARADFCKRWFENNGMSAEIDSALNVICPVGDDGKCDLVVFTAHTDTVFPDLTPLPFKKDDECIYSPSAGDDTACLAIMMLCARYIVNNRLKPRMGIIFVANSCEEGLGNLKGIREIMSRYGARVREMYSFDSKYSALVNRCVGSHRYEISVHTRGGHSFSNFGNDNAIHIASMLISELYKATVPHEDNSITTYNVGIIEGGTSINTIAQSCSFKYEYRSDNVKCLSLMRDYFFGVISDFSKKYTIDVNLLGERPCMDNVDIKKLDKMTEYCKDLQEKHSGVKCSVCSGSTDCNIPMSMGIPALAVGVFDGDGEHTREEYIVRSSLPKGMAIALELISSFTQQ